MEEDEGGEQGWQILILISRQVERPLKRESCLLKIWQAWGPEAQDVQFILKRVSSKGASRRSCKVNLRSQNEDHDGCVAGEEDELEADKAVGGV